jgi:hypothetical protein
MMWIVGNMKWIMLVGGALTCTMFYAAIAPKAALEATFGETLDGPVAEIVVRNWGVLIGLMGAMLIYGAFNIAARPFVLIVAGLSKMAFIALIMLLGQPFWGQQAGVAVVSDCVQISLFIGYLWYAPARVFAPEQLAKEH